MRRRSIFRDRKKLSFDYYLKNKQAIEALKAPVFEEKIVDYVIGKSNVSEKIVSIEELYSFDEDKKAGKKNNGRKSLPRNQLNNLLMQCKSLRFVGGFCLNPVILSDKRVIAAVINNLLIILV